MVWRSLAVGTFAGSAVKIPSISFHIWSSLAFKAAATSAAQRSEYPLPTSPSTNPPGMVPKFPVMTGTRSLQAKSFVCTVDITSSYKLGLVLQVVLDVMQSERSMYSEAIHYGWISLTLAKKKTVRLSSTSNSLDLATWQWQSDNWAFLQSSGFYLWIWSLSPSTIFWLLPDNPRLLGTHSGFLWSNSIANFGFVCTNKQHWYGLVQWDAPAGHIWRLSFHDKPS